MSQITLRRSTPAFFRAGVLFLSIVCVSLPLGAQQFRYGASPVPEPVRAALPLGRPSPSFGSTNANAVDLSPWFPTPGAQGMQNSCVAWATTYAVKSFQEHIEGNENPFNNGSRMFSPSFIYNQINDGVDEGSTLYDAATLLRDIGAVTLDQMPYTMDFRKKPDTRLSTVAAPWRIERFERLPPDDITIIKDYLRRGHPVVIGMLLHQNFEDYRSGIYRRTQGPVVGGHAMTVVGFDDGRKAFKIINSWGTDWGEGGYVWVDYEVFRQTNKEAMVMFDRKAPAPAQPQTPAKVEAGRGAHPQYVEVSWEAIAGVDAYRVFRASTPDGEFQQVGQVQGPLFRDQGVKAGTFYYYTVRSVAGNLVSEPSSIAQGFVQATPGLGMVRDIRTDLANGRVRLWWAPVDGALAYRVYRYQAEPDAFVLVAESKDPGWEDPDRAPGTRYYLVTAQARDREGPNPPAVSVTVPTAPVRPLVSPSGITVSQGTQADRVELRWQAVEGAQQYVILRYDDAAEAWTILGGTRSLSWADPSPPSRPSWYTVVSRVGNDLSPIVDFFQGWIRSAPVAEKQKLRYDDQAYRAPAGTERSAPDPAWFRADRVFTDSRTFFRDFVPQDFFFVDEERFFGVDPGFFAVPPDFFTDPASFF